MAYQTGTPANTQDLIDKLITFALANGYTDAGRVAQSTNTIQGLRHTTNGEYVNLLWATSNPSEVYLNTATAAPVAGTALASQPGACATNMRVMLGTAPRTFWFFADTSGRINCAVEWKVQAFQHINFGVVEKYGTYSGGLYVTGTWWDLVVHIWENYFTWDSQHPSSSNSEPFTTLYRYERTYVGHLRCTYRGKTSFRFGSSYSPSVEQCRNVGMYGAFDNKNYSYPINYAPNTYNSRAPLMPIELVVSQTDGSYDPGKWVPVGNVPNVAMINMEYIDPATTVLDDWFVFPFSAKNRGGTTADGFLNSETWAMAYRRT